MPDATVPQPDAIQLDPIRITADQITETEDGRVLVIARLAGVRAATLRHTFVTAHPALSVVFGLCLLAVAYWPLAHLVNWFLHGGKLLMPFMLLVIPGVWGTWLVVTAPRRGYVLLVEDAEGTKRFVFSRRASLADVRGFLVEADRRFGLRTADDTPRG